MPVEMVATIGSIYDCGIMDRTMWNKKGRLFTEETFFSESLFLDFDGKSMTKLPNRPLLIAHNTNTIMNQ